jgi:flagella basal body P-ring formation protein FlgA
MIRFFFAAAVIALATPACAQAIAAPPAPTLKPAVTVTGELVRIGDLLDNAGAAAGIAVFRAPDLGASGTVQAQRVLEAVHPHGLILTETGGIVEVTVTRASRAITVKEIEARLARALAAQHALGNIDDLAITFDRPVRTLHVEPNATAELVVTRLGYDPRQGRFDATFELPGSAAARRATLHFTGRAVETGETAVLLRPLARGEVIKASDLTIERRPKLEHGGDAVGHAAEAVGMAARRALRPGVLRPGDLMKPELVQRNAPVTLVYEVPGLVLTVRGKAAESGAEGDLITVHNAQSKRSVQGVVSGLGRVTVAAFSPPDVTASIPSSGAAQAAAAQKSE